ncbi:hypothetical protein [Paenibacillus marinisediminis]
MTVDEKKPKSVTDLEEQIETLLTFGDMQAEDPQEGARKKLAPRTEVRIQTMMDPIVEETIQYRQMAQELDDRYDEYMKRAGKSSKDAGSD